MTLMSYQVLDDRPGVCEGCNKGDFPTPVCLSVRQITWNAVLGLWLCADCRHDWSNWVGSEHATEAIRDVRKPLFLVAWEKEHGTGKQRIS